MRDYSKLPCWQVAHQLALDVYQIRCPASERYGLASQLRRATVSDGSNVAEGSGRRTQADFARFVDMSVGSASEVEYQLRLAFDLGYLRASHYETLRLEAVHTRRSLFRFGEQLRASVRTPGDGLA